MTRDQMLGRPTRTPALQIGRHHGGGAARVGLRRHVRQHGDARVRPEARGRRAAARWRRRRARRGAGGPLSSAASRSASTTWAPRARFTSAGAAAAAARSRRASNRPRVAGVSGSRLTTTVGPARRQAPRRRGRHAVACGRRAPLSRGSPCARQRARRRAAHLRPGPAPARSPRRPGAAARLPAAPAAAGGRSRRSRGAATSTAHSAVSAMAAFIAGSTMRASGTPAGSVGSASSRSTPAHSDWISRSCGRPCSAPGGGLATTAMSTLGRAASAARRVEPARFAGSAALQRGATSARAASLEVGRRADRAHSRLRAAGRLGQRSAALRPPWPRAPRCGRRQLQAVGCAAPRRAGPGPATPCPPACPAPRRPARRCR